MTLMKSKLLLTVWWFRLLFLFTCQIIDVSCSLLLLIYGTAFLSEFSSLTLQAILHNCIFWQSSKGLFSWCWYWQRHNMGPVRHAMQKLRKGAHYFCYMLRFTVFCCCMVNPIGNILVGGLVVEDEVKGSRSPFSSNKKKIDSSSCVFSFSLSQLLTG